MKKKATVKDMAKKGIKGAEYFLNDKRGTERKFFESVARSFKPPRKRTTSQKVIHCLARCMDCGLEWENYKTARNDARKHAKKTGHQVRGEQGTIFTFNI